MSMADANMALNAEGQRDKGELVGTISTPIADSRNVRPTTTYVTNENLQQPKRETSVEQPEVDIPSPPNSFTESSMHKQSGKRSTVKFDAPPISEEIMKRLLDSDPKEEQTTRSYANNQTCCQPEASNCSNSFQRSMVNQSGNDPNYMRTKDLNFSFSGQPHENVRDWVRKVTAVCD
jgi:hypothetical protein